MVGRVLADAASHAVVESVSKQVHWAPILSGAGEGCVGGSMKSKKRRVRTPESLPAARHANTEFSPFRSLTHSGQGWSQDRLTLLKVFSRSNCRRRRHAVEANCQRTACGLKTEAALLGAAVSSCGSPKGLSHCDGAKIVVIFQSGVSEALATQGRVGGGV